MARCGCSASETCNCSVQAGTGVSVTGSGTPGSPYVVAIDTIDCSQVRPCMSAGKGAAYNQVSGIISARLSPAPGNQVEFAPDGGLYVDTDCATVRTCLTEGAGIDYDPATGVIAATGAPVTAGCGLTGTGVVGDPLSVAVGAWPFPCDVDANAGQVFCDANGVLRGEPRPMANFQQQFSTTNYADLAVPAALQVTIETNTMPIANPDACRPAFLITEIELDVDLTLPPNSGGIYSLANDDMVRMENKGTSTMNDVHVQVTKVFNATIPAGGNVNDSIDIRLGGGFGGATYSRIQVAHRAFIFNM